MSAIIRVMPQMVTRRWRKPPRQPSAHMTAPVNLLKRHVIKRKAYECSGGPSIFEYPFENKKWYGIGDE